MHTTYVNFFFFTIFVSIIVFCRMFCEKLHFFQISLGFAPTWSTFWSRRYGALSDTRFWQSGPSSSVNSLSMNDSECPHHSELVNFVICACFSYVYSMFVYRSFDRYFHLCNGFHFVFVLKRNNNVLEVLRVFVHDMGG